MVLVHSKALRIAFRPGPVYLDTAKEKCIEWTDTNGGRQGGYRVSDLEKVQFLCDRRRWIIVACCAAGGTGRGARTVWIVRIIKISSLA